MYPALRLTWQFWKNRKAPRLGTFDIHRSSHICWPWDLDVWFELNNGRTLTFFDLGRSVLFHRMGTTRTMMHNGWGAAVAGASVRYRRRVKMFQRVEMQSRLLGWDDRFLYVLQSMWRKGDCTSQALIRSAVTNASGIVAPARVAAATGVDPQSPPLPGWVSAWITAEAERPWPPVD